MVLCGCRDEVKWLPSGLHNTPPRLTETVQTELDRCGPCDAVLLATGSCGGAVTGLRSGAFRLVIPKADDCITFLLGSEKTRAQYPAAYFLTAGWLRGERSLWNEYQYCAEKYGDQADWIFETLLRNYHDLALINTGCFPMKPAEEQCRKIAETLHLQYREIPGSLSFMTDLLSGNWDPERFLVLPPFQTVPDPPY